MPCPLTPGRFFFREEILHSKVSHHVCAMFAAHLMALHTELLIAGVVFDSYKPHIALHNSYRPIRRPTLAVFEIFFGPRKKICGAHTFETKPDHLI
jgi:hypothetical protein